MGKRGTGKARQASWCASPDAAGAAPGGAGRRGVAIKTRLSDVIGHALAPWLASLRKCAVADEGGRGMSIFGKMKGAVGRMVRGFPDQDAAEGGRGARMAPGTEREIVGRLRLAPCHGEAGTATMAPRAGIGRDACENLCTRVGEPHETGFRHG